MQINVLEYLERSALNYPNKIAFADYEKSITYKELQQKAMSVGTYLYRKLNSDMRVPVAVLIDHSVDNVTAFMGALYSGNFYVPIDLNLPAKRIEAIFEKLMPKAVLFSEKSRDKVIAVLDILKVNSNIQMPIFACIDDINEILIDENALKCTRHKAIDTDPAYIIFTSGSTGIPKGIVVSHKSLIDLTHWLVDTFSFGEETVIGNQTPFYFDASVKDIYIGLSCAATVYIIPKKLFAIPISLIEYLNEKKINTILWATSAITLLANSKVFEKIVPKYLEKIFFAGETMYAKHLNIWKKALPDTLYVNLYGPTEVTVDCIYYIVNTDFDDAQSVPIGLPCRNVDVFLLKDNGTLANSGELGEICVRGTGVANGYYNDPEKTKEVFIQNPLNPFYPEIIYKTGDIGKYNENSEIIFVSRKDNQVKHMGNRIELGDIEEAVNGLEKIEVGICFYDHKKGKIVLIFKGDTDKKQIINGIKELLPKYMFPNVIINEPNILYNANGKVNRPKLAEKYENGNYK